MPPQSDSGGPVPSDGGAESSTPLDSGSDARATKTAGLITGNNLFGRAMVYYAKSATEDKPNGVHSCQGTGLSTASGKTMTLNLANNSTSYFLNYHGERR